MPELPEEIALNANITDISSVLAVLARRPGYILQLRSKNALLFNDSDRLSVLDRADFSDKYYSTLFPFFRNKSLLDEHLVKSVTATISDIEFLSIDTEDHFLDFFRKVERVLGLFEDSGDIAKICCIREFFECRLFLRFNFCYSFSDFNSSRFWLRMLDVCHQFDRDELVETFAKAFSEDITIYRVNRIQVMLSERLYESVHQIFIDPQPPPFDIKSESVDELLPRFASLLSLPFFIVDRLSSLSKLVSISTDST
jgi:hypothetical protein